MTLNKELLGLWTIQINQDIHYNDLKQIITSKIQSFLSDLYPNTEIKLSFGKITRGSLFIEQGRCAQRVVIPINLTIYKHRKKIFTGGAYITGNDYSTNYLKVIDIKLWIYM
ncbi:MAG: hypothetical protein QW156_05010 [Candidatus Aenigmatarchaeota archaeon]